jgi:hypothetical protein
MAGYPLHLRMSAGAGREVLELAQGITLVEPGKAGGKGTITLAACPMAGRAGTGRSGFAAAESDRFSGGLEWVGGDRGRSATSQSDDHEGRRRDSKAVHRSRDQSRWRVGGSALCGVLSVAVLAAMAAACKPPPAARHDRDPAAVERGRALVMVAGCTTCHAFPDIDWPKGRAGPDLTTFDGRGPIAGALSNSPVNLAAFVRNAPAVKPGSTMPAMPLTPAEASDVAAYLYGIADD